jgi:hypothetical protein
LQSLISGPGGSSSLPTFSSGLPIIVRTDGVGVRTLFSAVSSRYCLRFFIYCFRATKNVRVYERCSSNYGRNTRNVDRAACSFFPCWTLSSVDAWIVPRPIYSFPYGFCTIFRVLDQYHDWRWHGCTKHVPRA